MDEGRPAGGRGEGDAVDEDVVADEQRLLHGAGGDLEVLEDEGHGRRDQMSQRCRWRRATRAGFRSGACGQAWSRGFGVRGLGRRGVVVVVNGISRSSSVYRLLRRGFRKLRCLVDDTEGTVPAGEAGEVEEHRGADGWCGRDGRGEAGRGGRIGDVGGVRGISAQGEVDEQGRPTMAERGDESPVAAVLAVVAVVAEDEVLAGGDGELAAVDELLHLDPPVGVDVGVGVWRRGKLSRKLSGGAGLVAGVGLDEGLAVEEDAAVAEADGSPGRPMTRLTRCMEGSMG